MWCCCRQDPNLSNIYGSWEMGTEVEISDGSRPFPLEKKSSRLNGLRSIWSAASIVLGKATSIKVENFQRDEEENNRNSDYDPKRLHLVQDEV